MTTRYDFSRNKVPTPDPKAPATETLGAKVETMFVRVAQRLLTWGFEFLSDWFVDIFDNQMKIMRDGAAFVSDDVIKQIEAMPNMPEWFKSTIQKAKDVKGESSWIIRLAIYWAGISGIITGGLAPIQRMAVYSADETVRSHLPDINTLLQMRRMDTISEQGFLDSLHKLGVDNRLIEAYRQIYVNLPTVNDLIIARWRGLYSNDSFRARLRELGYREEDINVVDLISDNIPPVSDLIHMLVREAFDDNAANKFGYDADLPAQLGEFFQKQGYNADWMKRYWRAHWQLPSPTQAYDMLHRGLIDAKTLSDLLKTADYPVFWREKMEKISYHVLTRVDVRRLLQSGVINEAKALKTYLEMGYNAEDAKLLTDYAVKGISNDERDLTRTDIISMYVDGLTDRSATSQALIKMGYDGQEADAIIKGADFDIAKAQRTDNINYVKEKYIANKIDRVSAISELTAFGLKSNSIERYLLNWDRSLEAAVKLPTLSDARRWFVDDRIDESKFREILKANAYGVEYIDLYFAEALAKKSQPQ